MPRAYFLVYRKDDRVGNDLSLTEPFEWLVENKEKFPESSVCVERWSEINISQADWPRWDSLINIDADEALLKKKEDYKREKKGNESFSEYLKRLEEEATLERARKIKEAEAARIKAEEKEVQRAAEEMEKQKKFLLAEQAKAEQKLKAEQEAIEEVAEVPKVPVANVEDEIEAMQERRRANLAKARAAKKAKKG